MIEIRLTAEEIQRLRDGGVLYRTGDGSPATPSLDPAEDYAIAITLQEGHAAVLRDLTVDLGATSPARQMPIDPATSAQPDEEFGESLEEEDRPQAGFDHI
jgi:hypothetical protein